jgi:hypothetical protein
MPKCASMLTKNPFSLWEKVVAEQPDEGLMVAIKKCNIEPPIATSRTSSVMLRMTPSPCKEKEVHGPRASRLALLRARREARGPGKKNPFSRSGEGPLCSMF